MLAIFLVELVLTVASTYYNLIFTVDYYQKYTEAKLKFTYVKNGKTFNVAS